MKISYLISTMNRKNCEFIKEMNIKDDAIIINQANTENVITQTNGNQIIKFISKKERGLSKSRNLAIKNCDSDICVLSDDDFCYYDDASKIILEAYKEFEDADIIAFYFEDGGTHNKKYDNKKKKVNYLTSMKISSAQITFKRESIIENNIYFNENFGTGAKDFYFGEENIFLFECLKKGLKIYIVPQYILKLEEREGGSTWFKGYNEKYFVTRGASYYVMTKFFFWLLIIQFAIRKRKLFNGNISFFRSIQYMFKGAMKYRKGE